MYSENLYNVYAEYINQNKKASRDTQKILENFRNKEEQLRDYHLALSILEKTQGEVGFYRLESAFNKMKSDLKDFNPNNIPAEIQKVYDTIEMLESYRDDIENLSKKIQKINSLWSSFIKSNPVVKNSILEKEFQKKYNSIIKKIGGSNISDSSGASYHLDNLKGFVTDIFETIEKAKDFQDLYIYMGDEAKALEENLNKSLELKEDSVEAQLTLINDCIDDIKSLKERSKLSNVGFPVIGVSTSENEDIVKYTISIKNNLVRYESFFNSSSMHTFNTGEYLYVEGVPVSGVFLGRDVIESIGPSSENIQLILDLNEKIEKFLLWIGASLFTLSIITFTISQIATTFIMALIVIISYLSKGRILNSYIELLREKYGIPKAFIFSKIDLFLVRVGESIDTKALKAELIKNFDTFLLTPLKGDYKWIQK